MSHNNDNNNYTWIALAKERTAASYDDVPRKRFSLLIACRTRPDWKFCSFWKLSATWVFPMFGGLIACHCINGITFYIFIFLFMDYAIVLNTSLCTAMIIRHDVCNEEIVCAEKLCRALQTTGVFFFSSPVTTRKAL